MQSFEQVWVVVGDMFLQDMGVMLIQWFWMDEVVVRVCKDVLYDQVGCVDVFVRLDVVQGVWINVLFVLEEVGVVIDFQLIFVVN